MRTVQLFRRRSFWLAFIVMAMLLLITAPVMADGTYHTEHLPLVPVADAPLRTGSVNNIHANGPQIYAREVYVVNGAAPLMTYDVYLLAYPTTDCSVAPILELMTASLSTNPAGNGQASTLFTPEDVAPFPPGDYGVRWELRDGGAAIYATTCTTVTLD